MYEEIPTTHTRTGKRCNTKKRKQTHKEMWGRFERKSYTKKANQTEIWNNRKNFLNLKFIHIYIYYITNDLVKARARMNDTYV